MSANTGVLIIAPIETPDSLDTFPTHKANRGLGGAHTVADLTARDAISVDRRQEGMYCYVASTQENFQLVGGILNANWVLVGASGTPTTTKFIGTITPTGTSFPITHNLNTKDLSVTVRRISNDEIVFPDVVFTSVNILTILFGTSITESFTVTIIG